MGNKTNKFSFVATARLIALAMVFGWFFGPSTSVSAASYTVLNTNDSGAGSFRQAVADANANSGADEINFAIPGVGPHTITLTSGNIYATDTVAVNGLTQPGSVCDGSSTDLQVHLDLNGTTNPFYFTSSASGSEINGLAIANAAYGNYGLLVEAPNTTVRCNFFGTFDGTTVASTNGENDYVYVHAPGVTVGGDGQDDMNLSLADNTSGRFIFNNDANDITFRNNIVGVTLDGTTAVEGPRAVYIHGNDPSGDIVISDNLLYSTSISIFVNRPSTNTTIANNTIGLNKDGTVAFADASMPIGFYASGSSGITIDNNHMATTLQVSAVDFSNAPDSDDVVISGNKINVTSDGNTAITPSSGISRAINTAPQADGVFYDNWQITDNQMYGNELAMMLYSVNGLVITNNTVGMNADRTECFENSARSVVLGSKNVIVGGTDPSEANAFCGTNEDITDQAGLEINNLLGEYTILGNTIISDVQKPLSISPPNFNTPKIISISEGLLDTAVTFRMNNAAGDWRVEFFENTEVLNDGGYPNARTFVGSVDVTTAGGPEEFTKMLPSTGLSNLSMTITEKNDSADGFGRTSEIGPSELEANLSVSTTDGVDSVTVATSGHQMIQTFTNTGPTTITNMTFYDYSACFTVDTILATGTATSAGSYTPGPYGSSAWNGTLEPNQILVLTFTGDISCSAGSAMEFNHVINEIHYNNYSIINTSDTVGFGDDTDIVGPMADLEVETTDNVDEVYAFTQNHAFVQTITNNGDIDITDITFQTSLSCFTISSVSTGGTAADAGNYNSEAWAGLLEPGQNLVLTFTGSVDCDPAGHLSFSHEIQSIESDGVGVTDPTSNNNNYSDTTGILENTADTSIAQTLTNPDSIAVGQTLEYDVVFTNQGPQSIDISQFDGSFTEYGPMSLFMYFIPPELDYVGYESADGIACTSFGPGSASMFGATMGNHSDWEIIMCYESTGEAHVLNANDSVSATIQVSPNENSDLDFYTHIFSAFGQNDPDASVMADLGSNDVIDYLGDNPIDNFATSAPMVDLAIHKTLIGEGSATPGDTVTYNIAVENQGPMSFDLNLMSLGNGVPIFSDIFPADSLSFMGIDDDENFACVDLGPGSYAYMGNVAMDHTNYQLLICGFVGDSRVFEVGETLNFQLQFEVNDGATSTVTNYAGITTIPTDPDFIYLNNEFANTEEDVLDTIDNENLSKITYTAELPNDSDADDDGVSDSVEDAGPNAGDANDDGIADSEQGYVASFTSSVTNKPVVLQVSEDCSIATVDTSKESANGKDDGSYDYPLGFMGFTLDCGDPGYVADVSQYYYDASMDNFTLRKYHPVNNAYFDVPDSSITRQNIDARAVVVASYQVQDGGQLDIDGVEDGTIEDPVGLAVVDASGGTRDDETLSATGFNAWLVGLAGAALVLVSGGFIAKKYLFDKK